MKKSILLTALLAVFSSTTVLAGGSLFGGDGEDGTGTMYGGASVGQSSDSTCNSVSDQAGALLGDFDCPNPSAWKVFGGYKVAPNLAVEGVYVDFGDGEATGNIPVIPGINAVPNATSLTSNATGFGVSGVASAPVSDELNVFGKIGVLAWERKSIATVAGIADAAITRQADTDGVDLSLGAGAEYRINDNWGIRGEYEHFEGVSANLYSVGATFSTY